MARIYTPGNSLNYASYHNDRVDELFTLAAAESDDAKRKEYYKEIQIIVHKECPYIPLYYANSGAAYTKSLSGAVYVMYVTDDDTSPDKTKGTI